jgi:hypothetical protein
MAMARSLFCLVLGAVVLCGYGEILATQAGEIDAGISNCDLRGLSFSECKWKAKDCFKPSPIYLTAWDRDSYNRAVDEYNDYIRRVDTYKTCLVDEGKRDMESFPDIVIKGVTAEADDVDQEAQRARATIEAERPLR